MRIGKWKTSSGIPVTGERLTVPLALEDGRLPGIARAALNLLSVLVLALVIWASFAEIRELAVAEGTLVPSGSEMAIEHLEGGIVEQVLVAVGDVVEAGQPLMRLRAAAATSDLRQIQARLASLQIEQIRLEASLAGRDPDFGDLARGHPELARNQTEIHDSQRSLLQSQTQALTARIDQKQAEIGALSQQRDAVRNQLDIQSEQLSMREQVLKAGFTSRRDFLDAKSRHSQVEADFASIAGRLAGARQELAEAEGRLREIGSEARRKLLEEEARVGAELAEAREALGKFRDRSERLYVRAPARGTVKELATLSLGKVIRPGEPVARLVPIGGRIVAEVRVRPRDIAFVNAGLEAEITVTALDPNVFGKLKGRVVRVSPSTFEPEKGESHYRAVIEIEDAEQAIRGKDLLPGMVVQANIVTGAKSVMRYLLKPVVRSLDSALSER